MAKKYVIIGGSHGIGSAVAAKMVSLGEVQVLSRTEPAVEGVTWFPLDILEGELPAAPESLSGLVYAPGSINLKPFRALKEKHFLEDLQINFLGAVKALQHYEKALKAGNGSAVLFSTVAVQTGMAFHASIAGAKGAVEGLVRSLAAEWAPNVRVNAVAPSLTDTPLAERLLRNDQQRAASAERHPLKRIGSADEVAQAAVYLLGEEAGWITGQVLAVDGGLSKIR